MKNENDIAWKIFTNTGKVEDYLKYCAYKNEKTNMSQGEVKNASEHRWTGDTRTEYR